MNQKKKNNSLLWLIRLLFSRFTLAICVVGLQVLVLMTLLFFFHKYILYFLGGFGVLSIILIIYISSQNKNNNFNYSWIILILVFPTFGSLFYLFCKFDIGLNTLRKRLAYRKKQNRIYLPQNEEIKEELKEKYSVYQHVNYLYQVGHFPVFYGNDVKYFSLGDYWYTDLLEKLEQAKYFIFLEFFIIANDEMWNRVLDILKRKAEDGVNVRVMYDGTCSFMLLRNDYPKELKKFKIDCKIFSPIVPILSTHYNNRDHRKIVVIDGEYAYTGGANMANEYINNPSRFYHWKDNMLRLSGEAVNSFTVLFLEMWNLDQGKEKESYKKYLIQKSDTLSDGYLLPFGDDPFDKEQIGKQCYLHLIENAFHSLDIIMPYFIVETSFFERIIHTVKKGVRVRLILPGIPDKKMINYVAKTYYKDLLTSGVEIYEYNGFTHAKMMICDSLEAVIGTINLDYRSLYLHFEDGVYLYKSSAILDMKRDYEETLEKCHRVTLKDLKMYSKIKLFIGNILRLFGPLL